MSWLKQIVDDYNALEQDFLEKKHNVKSIDELTDPTRKAEMKAAKAAIDYFMAGNTTLNVTEKAQLLLVFLHTLQESIHTTVAFGHSEYKAKLRVLTDEHLAPKPNPDKKVDVDQDKKLEAFTLFDKTVKTDTLYSWFGENANRVQSFLEKLNELHKKALDNQTSNKIAHILANSSDNAETYTKKSLQPSMFKPNSAPASGNPAPASGNTAPAAGAS